MTRFIKQIRIHIFCWSLFIAWETILIWLIFDIRGNALVYGAHYLATLIVFYLNALVLLPVAVKKTNSTLLSSLFIIPLFFVLYLLAHYVSDVILIQILPSIRPDFEGLSRNFVLRTLYRSIFFYAMSFGYFYLRNYLNTRDRENTLLLEKEQSVRELAVAQNLYLKAQINPHFVFNVLHFINYKLKPGSEESEALLHLSNIMHFAFSHDQGAETIRIGDELTQIEELIALQELRGGNFTGLAVHYDLMSCELRMIPLVLLTLVENIYKHGDLAKGAAVLSLDLDEDTECLVIRTSNKIGRKSSHANHSGMENITKRLRNAYAEKADFSFGVVDDNFKVELRLPVELLRK